MELSIDRVDGAFERLYRRFGARYVDLGLVLLGAAICVFVVPAKVALLTAPWHPSSAQYLRCVFAYELVLVLVAAPGTLVIGRRVAPATYRWVRGDHAGDAAPAAWASSVSGLPRWVGMTGLWWAAWCVPPSLYTGATLHFEWYGYVIYLTAFGGMAAVVAAFAYLMFEQAMRPVVREITASLPLRWKPPRNVMTLGVKALVLIPAINFFSAIVVASLVADDLEPALYLGQIVLLALVMSLTLSFVLTLMFRNSVLRRLEDLRQAMRSVDRGDLGTRVAPLAGDELDEMGASLNDMVAGLREREALREHNADLVVDLRRQADQLRDSRARLVAASDAARRQVERDLHDGAQQRLVLLGLKLSMAGAEAHADPVAALGRLDELHADLDAALSDLRDLAHGIYPAILESDGLPAALREAALRAGIPTTVACDGAGRYGTELEAAVYFCCLEAMLNAAKHGGENACARVGLTCREHELAVEISDDGRGFDRASAGRGTGLQNMTDRIGALGGTLQIRSALGSGTTISAVLPLAPAVADDDRADVPDGRPVSVPVDT
jgi:signal transduction histidine kinase